MLRTRKLPRGCPVVFCSSTTTLPVRDVNLIENKHRFILVVIKSSPREVIPKLEHYRKGLQYVTGHVVLIETVQARQHVVGKILDYDPTSDTFYLEENSDINIYRMYFHCFSVFHTNLASLDFTEPPSFLREYETQSLNMYIPPDETVQELGQINMNSMEKYIPPCETVDLPRTPQLSGIPFTKGMLATPCYRVIQAAQCMCANHMTTEHP